MSKRLASFAGPSTPNQSPIKPGNTSKPSTPSQREREREREPTESTFHRKLRSTLLDIRSVCNHWNDLILRDGLTAAKGLVDTRTDLSNALKNRDNDIPQTKPIVGPRYAKMEQYSEQLETLLVKLRKAFNKLVQLTDSLDDLFRDAIKQKGYEFVDEPLWFTWSLRSFVERIPALTPYYARSLSSHQTLIQKLQNDKLAFDEAQKIINLWVAQPHIAEGGWTGSGAEWEWEDICLIEVGKWESSVAESGLLGGAGRDRRKGQQGD